ncbi:alanyl-tRNA synthetase [Sorangium cellulosum]|uniref:Alanyl-tRNA synthetase n=1 Tax=Sorangium cellulosum TaxID=56 RepID=A0A150P817_SORCE|nr:alanyl-tRNA synthetase [Sorangium cellulosum]
MESITKKVYLERADATGSVVVTELIAGESPVVRVAETWFHPQGGGQKSDRGTIGPARVLHVAHNGGMVDHFVDSLAGLSVGGTYGFAVDYAWRRLNSVYHSSGHLIAGLVESLQHGLTAVAGHQWPGEARVEFEGQAEPSSFDGLAAELSRRLGELLSKPIEVKVTGDPYSSRAIQIGDFPPIPCGGTHVRALYEISVIRVLGIKRKGNRVRVAYDALPP